MTSEDKWTIVQSDKYKRHAKKYQRDQVINNTLCERLESLKTVDCPERLGDIKVGSLKGVYGTPLSKSVRLLYEVCHSAKIIKLLVIGDHKKVYGHD